MATREAAKNQRKADIVAAARALLREAGDPGFSMRALADRAQVSSATPYNLFGSKQAILIAVLDDDLNAFRTRLEQLSSSGIDLLFDATDLMQQFFATEPAFYRSIFAAMTQDDGSTLRQVVAGPRYALWKGMLAQATEAGLLDPDTDLDAFASTLSQQISANMAEWALQQQSLTEMGLRIHYGMSLMLLAIASDASHKALQARFRGAEKALQTFWRETLCSHLQHGDLPPDQQSRLADQLRHLQLVNPINHAEESL